MLLKFDGVNQRALNTGQILIILGVVFILSDIFIWNTDKAIWISIGCSLLASGMVILFQAILVDSKIKNYAEEWGLVKIYKMRSEKSSDSDAKLEKTKKQLDVVAFGLKSFRSIQAKKVAKLLKSGVNIRILTMNPEVKNPFLIQREKEENELEGQIRKSILDLVDWANKLNGKRYKGKVVIKGYKCMTLDFYWRVDDEIYIGPYWYGIGSQQTITYKFIAGKQGFEVYAEYFERLWENEENTVFLTKVSEVRNGKQNN